MVCARIDLAGVRVFAGHRRGGAPEGRAWQLSKHLIQRAGTGVDIAYAALYLASDESSWVTGQNFSIDGGVTAGFR